MKSERELINEYIKKVGVTKCPDGEAFGIRASRRQIAIAEYMAIASIDNETGRGRLGNNAKNRKGDIIHRRYYVEKDFCVRADKRK